MSGIYKTKLLTMQTFYIGQTELCFVRRYKELVKVQQFTTESTFARQAMYIDIDIDIMHEIVHIYIYIYMCKKVYKNNILHANTITQ